MRDHLSVEVFRDASSSVDSTAGREGVELVGSFVRNLRIVRSDRAIKLSGSDPGSINPSKVNWPRFSADLNVVLTDKALQLTDEDDKSGVVLGEAQTWSDGTRVAMVDTVRSGSNAQFVTAHETSHLIGLSYKRLGETDGHCDIDECLMYPYTTTSTEKTLRPQKGLRAWRERRGYVMPEWDEYEVAIQKSFCGNCIEQLAQRAFFLLMQKQGKAVPDTLL